MQNWIEFFVIICIVTYAMILLDRIVRAMEMAAEKLTYIAKVAEVWHMQKLDDDRKDFEFRHNIKR